jgi:hypothetical protein
MGRHSGLLLSVILTLNVAHARALDEAELATLRADRQGAAEQNAARVLARKLGAEKNLDAAPILLQLRDPIAMNWYVNEYLRGVRPNVPQSTLEAMALAAVKDPSFNADDSSSSTRSQFLSLLGPYQSRELFQLFYDGAKHALIDLRAGRTPKGYFWVDTGMLVPDIPGIEESDAALLPLIDRACWAAPPGWTHSKAPLPRRIRPPKGSLLESSCNDGLLRQPGHGSRRKLPDEIRQRCFGEKSAMAGVPAPERRDRQ